MKEKKHAVVELKNSKLTAKVAESLNVEVSDNTTTAKKSTTAKFSLEDETDKLQKEAKLDKNKVFAEVSDFFAPLKFDSSTLEKNLSPLVASGILSEDAKNAAIEKAKKEFKEANKEEFAKAQNLTFAEVIKKLQSDKQLFEKVCEVCKTQTFNESDYIQNGKVCIYRANDCEGKNYEDATLRTHENNVEFVVPLYVEKREVTTDNILLSIRYYQSKVEASKRLLNKVTDYKRILSSVGVAVLKAKENGFSKEQILQEVEKYF